MMDLDRAVAPDAPVRRAPWGWLAAVLVAGMLGGVVATALPVRDASVTREITFIVDGHAQLARVWTKDAPDGDQTPGRTRYADPTAAVVVVPDGMCRIVVDGLTVVERRTHAGPAVCLWVA